ncbi:MULTISPECIES: pyridoxal phosphate-dependent aminotransferase [unclassified Hyphomonas]|jgi:aspartate/methionine/tyrosine aminotransferase|uniref:pyridoxal phosphate-dependent aminotransferase n=1 Tax=unclassified Hyphomonas TaxID=2630699 RepID=UPI000C5FF33D|nr:MULTISPECIES: aminotransferase class I/II-fold pyridoxal phosphate-dependent enzyme [unclassified Hyphomonas]MAL43472.1 aminotransferase [Hyphomonas sp.]MAX82768.1 aminotransferase [Hyphomonas sp.]HAW56631.1 aminotransferase [Hyphomonas sp.]HBJ42959.1 aminotransferase [Hyphomonas sp.]HBN92685.1 aminotransferase [Hyphomonas sp.]|tara:strand:+ start:1 stop:1137 length:1137 start_codon:yes stop_codon:yes gene_type:complete
MGQDIDPFRAISVSKRAHDLKTEGRRILHMEFGQPSTPAPRGAIARAHEVLDTDPMGYWESRPLKERISQHYRDEYGVDLTPGRVTLTCGASPALVLALSTAFNPGDRIALARPGYVAYRNTLRALNLAPVEIACGADVRYQLTAAALDSIDPAPAGVIIASPANPTGTIIPEDDLAAIAAVAKAKNIRIISDEIYHGLSYGPDIRSMLEFDPDAYIVNSFSKYFSMPAWRLGWLVSPKDGAARTSAYVGNLFLTPPSLSQHAGLVAMDSAEELDSHVEVYRRNRELMLEALPHLGLEKIAPPDGAFYIYADISKYTDDSLAFCLKLLEDTGIATAPGVDFDPVEGLRFMRFSFALSTAQIEEALGLLEPWFAAQPQS